MFMCPARLYRAAAQPEDTIFESTIGGAIRRFRHHRSLHAPHSTDHRAS
jgi:hypothetical protein